MRVGHVLRVDDEELFPADLLCLYSALPDNACFIKTTNLDGESNLKIRRPVDLREAAPEEESDVMQIKARPVLAGINPVKSPKSVQGARVLVACARPRSRGGPISCRQMCWGS